MGVPEGKNRKSIEISLCYDLVIGVSQMLTYNPKLDLRLAGETRSLKCNYWIK